MGKLDRSIRVVLAAVLVVLFFTGYVQGAIGYVFLALAMVFLLTSFVNFCPLYALFGMNTCKSG